MVIRPFVSKLTGN